MITAIFVLVEKLQDSHTKFLPPGRVNRPLFGFSAQPYGDEIRISAVKKNGAAAEAGLQPGDRLMSVNGFRASAAASI
jgi:predicted metalloprotease with PDZ domain